MLRAANESNFIVYPNPANNFITIKLPTNGAAKTQITLYDAVGKKVYSSINTAIVTDVNTSRLPGGNYVLKIESAAAVSTQKIIIMHK